MFKESGNKIIVSADDFGISQKATENILNFVREGKIDRVEIMVSKNFSQEQIQTLLNSGIKLDIHFHLIKEKLDYWQDHPRKIDEGALKRIFFFLFNYLTGKIGIKKVEKEWEEQLNHFQKLFGRLPEGISSHEYIHFFPPYFKCVLKIAKKYGIKYVRFGKNLSRNSNIISIILNWLRKRNLEIFKEFAMESSDFMISSDWFENVHTEITKYPSGKQIEVVFHPELEDEYNTLDNSN